MYLMIDQDDKTGKIFVVVRQGDQELFRTSMPQACQVLLEDHQRHEVLQVKENNAINIAVKALLAAEEYIEAIKLVRKNLGWSLAQARLFVNGIRDAMRDAERDKIQK